jgi:hypothetical protein
MGVLKRVLIRKSQDICHVLSDYYLRESISPYAVGDCYTLAVHSV